MDSASKLDEDGSEAAPALDKPKASMSRRRMWWAAGIVAVAVIIVVAVVASVVVNKNRKTYTYEELYFPQGYNGTGLNGAIGGRRTNDTYNQLLAFGSSYSDNAHPRTVQYNSSFAPDTGYWNRHWSNGPIWVEYLRDQLGNWTQSVNGGEVTLEDYAYGGATTNNSIHQAASPDTGAQMQMYLTSSAYQPETSKPLVAMFTTTNDITATFSQFWDDNNTEVYQNETAAMDVISQSAQSLTRQLVNLIPSNQTQLAPDFLVLPILPVEMTPRSLELAEPLNTTTDLIARITRQYNKVLMQGAQNISDTLGNRGNVFTYDVPAWMYAMRANPGRYSIRSATESCTAANDGKSPESYVFWDHLHLVTTMQDRLADIVFNILQTAS